MKMCLNINQHTELVKLLINQYVSIVISTEVRLLCRFHFCVSRSKMIDLVLKDTMKTWLNKKLLQF